MSRKLLDRRAASVAEVKYGKFGSPPDATGTKHETVRKMRAKNQRGNPSAPRKVKSS